MNVTLSQILSLVGKLDDSPGEETPRERFRIFLKENVRDVGQLRDYVEECLRSSGEQYSRALQDLINHVGGFLGFEEITFGRYHGVKGEIGFDGFWKSPKGLHVVIEVKTTEAYAIKAATLVGYVDELISEKRIASWDEALGLYVVGRPDAQIRQLENAIVGEKRTHQLRLISVESLLSLAEMINEYDVSHEDILAVFRPSGPKVDPLVNLMARLVAQAGTAKAPQEAISPEPKPNAEEPQYWLTPVRSDEQSTAEETIASLVGKHRVYAFAERTPGRRHLKRGDHICFYASGIGVVAQARVGSVPEKKSHPAVRHSRKYPWVFQLEDIRLYLDKPIIVDADLRAQLSAFQGRDPARNWAWFVQGTHRLSEHDFRILSPR